MILIIITFCELLLRISPRIINSLRSYIKHSKDCFLLFPNTSKLVKKNSAAPRFSNLLLGVWKSEETLFLVFDLLPPNRYIPHTKWLVWPAIFWQIESSLSLAHRPEIVGCGCFPLKPEKGENILRVVGLKPYITILLILSSGWSEFSWTHCVQAKFISRLHRYLPPRRTASQHGMSNEWIGSSGAFGSSLMYICGYVTPEF